MKKLVALTALTLAFSACSNSDTFTMPSSSMEDTIQVDDKMTVDRDDTEPQRGDIIIYGDPRPGEDAEFVKRVIALPSETVEGREDGVYVNDRLLNEPYVKNGDTGRPFATISLRADEYFVMGDNRAASQDSRFFGPITSTMVTGTVTDISNP